MPYVHIKSDRAFSLNMGSDAPVDVCIEYDDAGRVVDMNILSKPQPETAEVSGKSVRHDIAVRRAKETAHQLHALVKWLDESGQPNAARRAHEIAMGAEKLLEELGAEM